MREAGRMVALTRDEVKNTLNLVLVQKRSIL